MIKNEFTVNTSFLNNKSILITGGTGSFGQVFVKKLLKDSNLRRLVILSRDEYKQHIMKEELNKYDKSNLLRFFIGDVRDSERLNMAFRDIDYVVHAAALKQITTAEYNPFECIHTNVLGAQNIVKASLNCKIKKVISLSTDKAANPINLYGASKLAADKVFISSNQLAGSQKTIFSLVRYGNVLGSRGSVLQLFKKIINDKKSTHLPITDGNMTRFWITLNEAADFVIKSLKSMKGGETFIPKIPSMSIFDIVKSLNIKLKKKVIGIRPGEKMHEILITLEESKHTYEFENYYIILPEWENKKFKSLKTKKVSNNFEYVSNKNSYKLSPKKLRYFFGLI